MHNSLKYILLYYIVLITACANNNSETSGEIGRELFDIPTTIQNDIKNLNGKTLSKTVIVDGETETQVFENPNWENELALFLNADINKPALIEKYIETKNSNQTNYVTTDEKLVIKKVQVNKRGTIIINKEKANFLYESTEELTWKPSEKTYSIISDRKVIFGDEQHIEIKGKIE